MLVGGFTISSSPPASCTSRRASFSQVRWTSPSFLWANVVVEPAIADGTALGLEGEHHDVGFEAVDHGTRLRARAAVRLLDRQLTPRALGIGSNEPLVQLTPELAGRVVRYVQQLDGVRRAEPRDHQECRQYPIHASFLLRCGRRKRKGPVE